MEIVNDRRRARHALQVSLPRWRSACEPVDEIRPGQSARVALRFTAVARGEQEVGPLRVASVYPLGFLKIYRRATVDRRHLVYPEPVGNPRLPVAGAKRPLSGAVNVRAGGDEFAGVRAYVAGESQRHIDWKAVARGQPLMTKQFAQENAAVLHLDYDEVPGSDTERRLSQLALWIVEAERLRRSYGLRLGAVQIPPGIGEAHRHRCLAALARFS